MNRARVGAVAVLAAGAFVVGPARADDTGDLEALLDEPLVATASKTAEAISAAPAISTVITAEELRSYGIRSLDEAINYLSVGMVAETPLGAAEIGSRGVLITQDYGSHVLLLIDGHAVNEVWGGSAYFERAVGVPFELIDRIEVILGPGSVLYGSNAMLGVINIVTKRARDYHGLHAVTETEILPGTEGVGWSLRTGAGTGFDFDLAGAKSEVTFQGEYYTLEGPPFRFGPQEYGVDSVTGLPRVFSDEAPPGFWGGVANETYFARVPSGYLRFAIGDWDIKARAALFERSYPYHGGDFDDPGNYELDRWLSLDSTYRVPIGSHVQLLARVYGDLYDYQQFYPSTAPEDCLEGQDQGCLYYLKGVARWAGAELSGTFDWLGDARFSTMLGADARIKNVESFIDIPDLVTGESPGYLNQHEATELALGVYAQQTLAPTKWLAFNVGARVDADERYGVNLSPRSAATVAPWKGGALKGIVSHAFRGPTAFEQYYVDPTSQIPPLDLKPEKVRSIEGAFEQRVGTQRFEVGAFQTSFSDLVLTQDLTDAEIQEAIARGELQEGISYAQQTRNVSQIEAYGFTARFEGSALSGRLRYAASLTRAHSERQEPNADPVVLGAATQLFGNLRVAYDFSDGAPVVALATRFTGDRPVSTPDDTGRFELVSPQLELRTTVSGPFRPLPGLGYRVSGSYAFADRYPYVVGPALLADGSQEKAPVDQVKIAAALYYDLDP